MGDVVSIAAYREDRDAARRAALAEQAARHPALRWVAGDTWWLAHRRDPTEPGPPHAACGHPGSLVLAPPGVPLCPACYPRRP